MLKAGVAIRDITPMGKTLLCGYPDPADRSALLAHDPLYASAYYFENGRDRLLYITADLVYLTNDRAAEIQMLVEKHTGIPRQNVAVSCTHTHSGPNTDGPLWGDYEVLTEQEPANNDRIRDLMLAAAKEAVSNTFEAKIGWGVGKCGKEMGIGGNRHDPVNGPSDDSVTVIAIKDGNDDIRGCIVNYSMHPTVLHAHNFFYTADFPCYIRETLTEQYPFMVFGFQMGCSGDQSTRFFRSSQTYEEAKRIGGTIGSVALDVLNSLTYVTEAELKCAVVPVVPPMKVFPSHAEAAATLAHSQKVYDDLVAANAPYAKTRAAQSVLEGSIFMNGLTASIEKVGFDAIMGDNLPIRITAIRIGQCCMVGVNGELFVTIGNAIKADSPFEVTTASSLTNGTTLGYICADEAYDRFCYEAQASTFAKGIAQTIVDGAAEAIRQVQ